MRMKTFLIVFGCVVITSYLFVMISSTREQHDSIKTIVAQTHQQIKEIQENLVSNRKVLEIDSKYLILLGFASPSATSLIPPSASPSLLQQQQQQQLLQQQQHQQPVRSPSPSYPALLLPGHRHQAHPPHTNSKSNFTIVSYVLSGQTAAAISLIQNIVSKLPNDTLLLYDVGLSEDDSRALNAYCNNTKCSVIVYDLSVFPAYVSDERMHAFRPLLIKDALNHSKAILFIENNVRIRSLTAEHRAELFRRASESGVQGWTTRLAVSSRTHPKMFEYFQTDDENFMFLPMVSMDAVLFFDSEIVNEKILLPWIKCTLTLECIHPIGAQSGGCRFNKKPLYRYSGCHAYDVSAFNIVLGLTWNFDETKYSLRGESNLYYLETLEQATKMLENKRKNISDTSEHQFTNDD